MPERDYLREDERNDLARTTTAYDIVLIERLQQRLAEARRVLEEELEFHRTESIRLGKNGKCYCHFCDEAAAALEGVERP